MQSTPRKSMLAMVSSLGLALMASSPMPAENDRRFWPIKVPKGQPKGRSNDKPSARLKEREKAKAAHKARMKQKRKK